MPRMQGDGAKETKSLLRTRESFFRDPYFSDCWEIMDRHRREFEQKASLRSSRIGRSREEDDLQLTPLCRRQHFPTATAMAALEDSRRLSGSGLGIQTDREHFKVSLDVQQFKPEELVVKTCDNNTIVIEGKHEEKKDSHGFISRNFTRKYTLPDDIKVDEVECNFTSDGVLQITAPRHQARLTQNGNVQPTTNGIGRERTERTSPSTLSSMSQKIEEHRKRAEEQFEKSTAELLAESRKDREEFGHASRKSAEEFLAENRKDREDFGHSRLLRMFDPYFQAFPEFDPVPFWKRGHTSSLLEEFRNNKKGSSLLDDFSSTNKKTSLLEDLNNSGVMSDTGSSGELQSDSDNFKVMLDVQQFLPEELTVKTFDYFVVIEGKHEAKSDPHGFITRQFRRKYMLPRDVKATDVQCNLSSDGILLVTGPRRKGNELEMAERANLVPIQQQQGQKDTTRSQHEERREEQVSSSAFSTSEAEREHVIPIDSQRLEKAYESEQRSTATASRITGHEHVIPIVKPAGSEKSSKMSGSSFLQKVSVEHEDRPRVTIQNGREHVVPIDLAQQHGVHVEFPESRPESSASTIPFEYSRQGSEAPVSVASSAPPSAPILGKGERIINISIGP